MFKAYDVDQSGGLITSEVSAMLAGNEGLAESVKQEAALMFLVELDADSSGAIELPEWLSFVKALWRTDRQKATAFVRMLESILRKQRAKR